MKPICYLLLTTLLTVVAATAQNLSPLKNEIEALAKAISPSDQERALANLRDNLTKATLLDTSAVPEEGKKVIQEILAFRRADVQNGATSGASGSTSAILSPLLPAIFGVGIETGSLTRTVSGTTITLKANPAGLLCAAGENAAAIARRDDDSCKTFWKRVGLTASFDMGRGEKKAELENLQTLKNQFTEFTARVELLNHRKATGGQYRRVFRRAILDWEAKAQRFVDKNVFTVVELIQAGVPTEVETSLKALMATPSWATLSTEDRVKEIESLVKTALARVKPSSSLAEERRFWLESLRANRRLQSAIANAAVLTTEYSYQQPDLAMEAIGTIVPQGVRPPNLHTARFIYAQGWGDKRLDLTANAAASWFSETRPGMRGLFRDCRSGVEAKFKLRDIANYGAPTLSFAGLYVFLNQEPVGLGITAFNQVEIGERGHIGLFQAKVEFPTANNAIRIPVSFTYSNRTELIKESEVRGQIGISFNLDSVFVEKQQ